MSAPSVSLPAEIAELMTQTYVLWESNTGNDGYGQPVYATPVQIDCWVEGEGFINAGVSSARATISSTIEVGTLHPELNCLFDGDDANVRSFQMTDRFSFTGLPGASGITLQPTLINTFYGPNFNNLHPWLILVAF